MVFQFLLINNFGYHQKKIRAKSQENLTKEIQEGTEKLNILTVLEEERNYIDKMISTTKKSKEKASISNTDIGQDMSKLKEIVKHQKNQIAVNLFKILFNSSYKDYCLQF